MKSQIVTIEEQEEQGLRRPKQPANFVTPVTKKETVLPPASLSVVEHNLGVQPTATQHIEMRTSAVDRAVGYLIASVPLYGAFAFAVLLLACLGWNIPIFSITALIVFWVVFVATWVTGWIYTLLVSAEGVSLFEAKRKWDLLDREQRQRWEYYKELNKNK